MTIFKNRYLIRILYYSQLLLCYFYLKTLIFSSKRNISLFCRRGSKLHGTAHETNSNEDNKYL